MASKAVKDATGVPTDNKRRLAYWVIAGLAGGVAGSVVFYTLKRTDPLAKVRQVKDFGSVVG